VPRRPWTGLELALVVLVGAAGLFVAWVAAWVAFFGLPSEGFLSTEPATTGQRAWGVAGAGLAAFAQPAGLWTGAVVRRSVPAAVVAGVVGVGVLVTAAIWAVRA
jgi:hypothetical protein